MSFKKNRRPQSFVGVASSTLQLLTAASTGTVITNRGVTVIRSTSAKTFKLAKPSRAGVIKDIGITSGATTSSPAVIVLAGPTTASNFYGSTFGRVTTSTGTHRYRSVRLVSMSTSQWMPLQRSSGVGISG